MTCQHEIHVNYHISCQANIDKKVFNILFNIYVKKKLFDLKMVRFS